MTSNLGSDIIQAQSGEQQYEAMKASVMQTVATHFRPEFINRVDDMVVFHSLEKEQIKAIAKIQLAGLRKRLHDLGFKLEISGGALDKLADAGFDPVYGARPLKRAIQQFIENPLAELLLSSSETLGETIRIEYEDSGFSIH